MERYRLNLHLLITFSIVLLLDTFFNEISTTDSGIVNADYHPFPSKAAALIYLLANSPTPIVCLLL